MRALMDKWVDLILIKPFRLITPEQQKDNKNQGEQATVEARASQKISKTSL